DESRHSRPWCRNHAAYGERHQYNDQRRESCRYAHRQLVRRADNSDCVLVFYGTRSQQFLFPDAAAGSNPAPSAMRMEHLVCIVYSFGPVDVLTFFARIRSMSKLAKRRW